MPQPSEPIALIDLDGTLADFDGAMAARMAELKSPGDPDPNPVTGGWEPEEPWLRARRSLIKNQPGFWRSLPIIPDGFEVLTQIQSVGFEVHVLTKGPSKTTSAYSEKIEWCQAQIPGIPITITADKGLVFGRVLFDDWPPYIERWLAWRPRGLVIMLDHPWNQGFEHPNVFRYRQLNAVLQKVTAQRKERRTPDLDPDEVFTQLARQNEALLLRLQEAKNR
jgi:5'(3')-deoxyribonucleotidase